MNKYLIVLKEESDLKFLEEYNASNIEVHMKVIVFARMEESDATRLENHELVESIEQDGAEGTDVEPSDEGNIYETSQTSYAFDMMNIQQFHKEGYKGQGLKIGILDTGVQKHTNLKVESGLNVYDSSLPWDNSLANSHGTLVAGVINAQGKDGNLIGIAPEAKLYAVRIDNGNGAINSTTWSSQIAGMSWAVDNGMDAVNCSFSSRIESKARKKAFEIASNNGVAIFCSAGNTQPSGDTTTNTAKYPAKYPFTIANANINSNKTRYTTSCIGQGLNFSNGGVKIITTTTAKNSTAVSSSYSTGSTGTSLASPATLGIYILYKQMYQESKEKILQRMTVNAEPLGNTFWYGAGLPKYPTKNYLNIQVRG